SFVTSLVPLRTFPLSFASSIDWYVLSTRSFGISKRTYIGLAIGETSFRPASRGVMSHRLSVPREAPVEVARRIKGFPGYAAAIPREGSDRAARGRCGSRSPRTSAPSPEGSSLPRPRGARLRIHPPPCPPPA